MNLTVAHHADLEPIAPGDVLLSVSLGADGDLVALWSAPNGAVRITMYGALLLELSALDLAFPTAHLMPGDTILTVGARARNPLHHNAIHHAADGTVLTTARFGDAIEHVVTTHTGDVWVGYFDEGAPAGLVRFGPDLRRAWTYDGPVIDCYALNVTDRAVWTCYHPGVPVVRIHNDRATAWRNPVTGVSGTVAGLDGDHVIGREHELHVVTGNAWYRLDIAEPTFPQ